LIGVAAEDVPAGSADPLRLDGGEGGGLGNETGQFCRIAVDGKGRPHISYWSGFKTHSLKYAWHDGEKWRTQVLDSSGYTGEHTSIALGKDDLPHISYYGRTALNYYHDGKVTTVEDSFPGQGNFWEGLYSSIALDKEARPHIGYVSSIDQGKCDVRYAWYDGGKWHTATVESQGRQFGYRDVSLAIDMNGGAHLTYYDMVKRSLKYVRLSEEARLAGKGWEVALVDGAGGMFDSLAVDANGHPHVSYTDGTALKYAHQDGQKWLIETVDEAGIVGWHSSLALDKAGHPNISYYDFSNRTLRYAFHDGTGWRRTVADAQGDVGTYSALALGPDGMAHLAYYDATNGALKYTKVRKSDLKEINEAFGKDTVGKTTIEKDMKWERKTITLTGDIEIGPGSTLTLEKAAIAFSGSHKIHLGQGSRLILRNSLLQGSGGLVNVRADNGFIHATNSAFQNVNQIRLNHCEEESRFENCIFLDSPSIESGSFVWFERTRGIVTGCSFSFGGFGVHYGEGGGRCADNTARYMRGGTPKTEDGRDLIIRNEILEDIWMYSNIALGYTKTRRFHCDNITLINSRGGITLNMDNDFGLVENIRVSGATGMSKPPSCLHWTLGNDNCIARNVVGLFIAGGNYIPSKNNVFYNVRLSGTFDVWCLHDSFIYDSRFAGITLKAGQMSPANYAPEYRMNVAPIPSNNTYGNIAIEGGAAESGIGVSLSSAKGIRFIDVAISGCKKSDISFLRGTEDIKFINTKFRPEAVVFADDKDMFRPYWYCDVLAVDAAAKPVPGAVVKITNEVDPAVAPINRNGTARTEFSTGKDGRTPLPVPYLSKDLKFDPPIEYDEKGDLKFLPQGEWHKLQVFVTDATTAALCDYSQTQSGKKHYTYTIEVAAAGYAPAKVSGVDPDTSWYREDPGIPAHTIKVVLKKE
jgi:hypothetical protein